MARQRLTRRHLLLGTALATALGVAGHLNDAWGGAAGDAPGNASLPRWTSTSPRLRDAYRVAQTRGPLLATLDCYCGCGQLDPPHTSLLDCFIQPDGSWDTHASGCGICQDEALDANLWAAEGLSPAEIGRRIDEKYQEYGPPTRHAAGHA